MWLLIAEMVLALSLIVFIMVWTLRARVDHQADESEAEVVDKSELEIKSESETKPESESTQAKPLSDKN